MLNSKKVVVHSIHSLAAILILHVSHLESCFNHHKWNPYPKNMGIDTSFILLCWILRKLLVLQDIGVGHFEFLMICVIFIIGHLRDISDFVLHVKLYLSGKFHAFTMKGTSPKLSHWIYYFCIFCTLRALCFKLILQYYAATSRKATLPSGHPEGPNYLEKTSNRIRKLQ